MTVRSRAFWALYALGYDRIWDSPLTQGLAARVATTLPRAGQVVDLGGGTGLMTAAYPARTVSVDTSPAMLRRATSRLRVSETITAPAENTGLTTGTVSAVIVSNVLHLHPNPEAVVLEAHRLCKQGTIAYTWPVDGLTPDDVRRIDRLTGRRLTASITADLLRQLFGPLATSHGLSRHTSRAVMAAVRGICTCELVIDEIFLTCQQVIAVRRSPSAQCPVG